MANPNYPIACTQGQWTIIATAVKKGQVWRKDKDEDDDSIVIYYHTYRLTGETAPTAINEGVLMFAEESSEFEIISAHELIDIYVWCKNGDGTVRVDV